MQGQSADYYIICTCYIFICICISACSNCAAEDLHTGMLKFSMQGGEGKPKSWGGGEGECYRQFLLHIYNKNKSNNKFNKFNTNL